MAIRIRGGQIFVYPQDVFFNPSLYNELGLELPEVIRKAKAQEAISVEQLAEVNPDVLKPINFRLISIIMNNKG